MARIVMYSMAHRGDVYPFVPVASELVRRGHDVTYVVPREFHPQFSAELFRCAHSGTDFSPVELDRHGGYLARWGKRFGGALVLRLYFGQFTIPHLDELFAAIDDQLDGADLLVSNPAAALIGAPAAERRDIPWITGDLFPMLVPTAANPPSGLPNLGRAANRMLWRIGRSPRLERLSYGDEFKAFRRRLGLPVPDGWNIVDARLSPFGNLGLVSKHYVEPQPDWPDNYELVGSTDWSGPDKGALPDDVLAFLDAGEPPVVVTLGTSGASARPELFERAAAALDAAGARGLFLTSNAVVNERVRSAGIDRRHGIWPFVPLAPLLSRCRAVIHSGAHGTNAMTLRAGLPSAVVPVLFDQVWHARRQEELGSGVWIRREKHFDRAVDRLLHDPTMRTNARAVGARLAAEDGTTRAADAIDAFLAGRS